MRVFAGLLLAVLIAASLPGHGDLAVTLDLRPAARACAVLGTATIVSYGGASRKVAYRFVHSDGSVAPIGQLAFEGDGAVAQSVTDEWKPIGPAPWMALEIVSPKRIRSASVPVPAPCARRLLATTPHRGGAFAPPPRR
ncbi:MAG: hypothetical protein ABI186_02685 [Candidatus Elarobacter sp.]